MNGVGWVSSKSWGHTCCVCACSVICVCLAKASRAGHKAWRCIVTSSPSYLEQKGCCWEIMWLCVCVCSTLVMWCELRAGSEKCWVALRGSFHPGSRKRACTQGEESAGRVDGCQDREEYGDVSRDAERFRITLLLSHFYSKKTSHPSFTLLDFLFLDFSKDATQRFASALRRGKFILVFLLVRWDWVVVGWLTWCHNGCLTSQNLETSLTANPEQHL